MTLKIKHKLAIALLMASIISMSVIAALGYYIAKKTSTQQTFEKLTSIRNSKAQEISDYFHRLEDLANLISSSKITQDAFTEFNAAFMGIRSNNGPDSKELSEMKSFRDDFYFRIYTDTAGDMAIDRQSFLSYLPSNKEALILQSAHYNSTFGESRLYNGYRKALLRYDREITDFVDYSDFGGLIMINSETGDIVYTVNKLSEFGGNVLSDSLGKTNLAAAFRELRFSTKPETKLVRFQNYFPAYLQPKAFMLCPIFRNKLNIAVIALRVPSDFLNSILTFNGKWEENGMGKTGEIYMVGGNNMLRSESRSYLEDPAGFIAKLGNLGYPEEDLKKVIKTRSTLINIRIRTDAVERANNGETGIRVLTDYMNREVLCAFMPLDIMGLKYAVIAQIDTKEAFENVGILKNFMIYSFIAVLISMIVIAFLLAGFVTKPINNLTSQLLS